jgi:carbonic anhydrase
MFADLLHANATYADDFAFGHLHREPQRALTVVTCMDARIDALAVLGLHEGDAHILRNAGGRVSDDVLRSLLVSTHLLGVRNIVVMHHTDCGMASLDRHEVRQLLTEVTEEDWESLDLLTIEDREQALRNDVERVRTSALLPDVAVVGWVYDVVTGRIHEVVGATTP